MNIGDLSKQSGISAKTIRYYEAQGLLPAPPRLENGYRDYPDSAVSELGFLRRARQFGFSLEECGQLVQLWRNPKRRSAEVHQLVTERQQQVVQQIAELQETQQLLTDLLSRCADNNSPHCAIIDSLSERSNG
ncbi:MerR family DNA-binding transcriptional regulator [bacterium SCSIO 12696]|nr:MerR family DNA-binding transcriptional regulator [bacterium SCSIO 12696]